MLQFFHKQARDELHARDVARGLPKSGSCGKWIGHGGDKTFIVDPLLSRLKSSGQEHNVLRGKKWSEFCAEPRDPTIELAKIGFTPSPDETPRARVDGLNAVIESAISRGIAAGLTAAGVKAPKVT